jgi:glycosyltransferase involved in cell wall biosynthesis
MAAGVPVVATRVGGNSEVVAHGETGFLVPPRDPAALAEGILTLLRDAGQARTFGEAGRRRVSQRFSLERMIRDTELVYEELLEARRISSGRSHGRTTRPA